MKFTSKGYRVVSIVLKAAVVCIALVVIVGTLPDTWMMPLVLAAGALIVADVVLYLNRPRRTPESGTGPGAS